MRTAEEKRATRRAYYARNRERLLAEKRRKRLEDGDAMRARDREWGRTRATKHGIGPEELARLYEEQGGRCAICDVPAPMRGDRCLHIDHDHATDERRGLLCFNCNRALDVMERVGPTWALRVLAYLGDPPLRRLRRRTAAADGLSPEEAAQLWRPIPVRHGTRGRPRKGGTE